MTIRKPIRRKRVEAMFHTKPQNEKKLTKHRISITVEAEEDLLKRTALLNTALLTVLTGTRLIRVLSADYEIGRMDMIIEAHEVKPDIAPGLVKVEVRHWH